MSAFFSPVLPVLLLLMALAVALLGPLFVRSEPDPDRARAMAMAAGAMIQAARYAVRGRIPSARRDSTVRAVLNINPCCLEQAFNGPGGVAWGVRRYLGLATKQFREPQDEPVLQELERFMRLARRLRRHPTLEPALRRDLQRIGTLHPDERTPALVQTMNRVAAELGEHEHVAGDRALAWFYGLRVAWLWRSLGGWHSPASHVPRAVNRAALDIIRKASSH
ncbi:MAG: hypothetical protein P8180_02755 [Gammaproteobacteria bacterium]|jgi:CII-binding regulator of phage lambda lysogenization HflD